MPTTPTSIVNRLMGVEAFTDALSLPAGTTIGGATVDAANSIVNATAATLTVTAALHAGKIVTLNRATGIAIALPGATGTGNRYRFFVGTAVSGGSHVWSATPTTDVISGINYMAKAATALTPFLSASNTNTITFNGGTTGGALGDWVDLIDVATAQWWVSVLCVGTSTVATPFSHV